ncbi:hypothetical protein MNAN1_003571 [Malassezia nana]|uniref:Uncharacterized protein n=1 Tax=Malassezia nana TaxID=180528 RepID=A0AAF0EP93_9BASI|nr:hypothetical protein MNAN1_003571 [Malassezia nana]
MPSTPLADYTALRQRFAPEGSRNVADSGTPLEEEGVTARPSVSPLPLQRRLSQFARSIPHMRSVSSLGHAAQASSRNVATSPEPRGRTNGAQTPQVSRASSMPMPPPVENTEETSDAFDTGLLDVHRSMTNSPMPLQNDVFLLPTYAPSEVARASPSASSLRVAPPAPSQERHSVRFAENVVLVLEPATRALHMFGPLQVTGSYSLSGTVKLSLPHATNACESIDVLSLRVVFTGYSMYVDGSGRYSCVRLCEVARELVDTPLCANLPPHGPSILESVFDLGAPGWLPASISTRSVSTFYSLQATAILRENQSASSVLLGQEDVAAPQPLVPIAVRSAPMLVVVHRTRDLVAIPSAQRAEFTGADVPLVSNPFRKPDTNPFRRASSVPTPRCETASPNPAPPRVLPERFTAPAVPLRHYSHMPQLHLPTPSVIQGKRYEFLSIKVTLSVPSHSSTQVSTRGEQAPLVFGLHITLDPLWQHVRYWSDLRLCELEASCVQMEKYSSSLSQSYCLPFALPTEGSAAVDAAQLPVFDEVPRHLGLMAPQSAAVQTNAPHPFHRHLVDYRLCLERNAAAPTERQNAVERFRAYTVGPLPERERDAAKDKRAPKDDKLVTSPRRRRAVSNALHRLSMLGSSRDNHASSSSSSSSSTPPAPAPVSGALAEVAAAASGSSSPSGNEGAKASYIFDGHDGNGLLLQQKRVRLSFSLPLVPSSSRLATMHNAPQLLPDYESPHMRVRHKLKVKMRFGFGASPLAPNVGMQSVVMSVPVRFSEASPGEALAQAPPLVLPAGARPYVPDGEALGAALPSAYAQASRSSVSSSIRQAYLPAYTQLFRADGSRLGDDEEVLPPYPDQRHVSLEPAYPSLSALLASRLHVVPDEEREGKSAASVSMVDALNAHDDELFNVAAQMDDDMMDDRMANEAPFDDEMELGRDAGNERPASPLLSVQTGAAVPAPALSYMSPSLGAVASPRT